MQMNSDRMTPNSDEIGSVLAAVALLQLVLLQSFSFTLRLTDIHLAYSSFLFTTCLSDGLVPF